MNAICRKLGFALLEACEFEFPKGHFMTCNDWRLDLRLATVPLHFEGWGHFSKGADALRESFDRRGLSGVLRVPRPDESVRV